MAELTEQQIEQATKAWKGTSNVGIKECFRAVAPYLQLPWDEPTEAEIQSALITFDNSLRMRVDSQEARLDAMAQSLGWLIASRNAALPVDPRRQQIADKLFALTENKVATSKIWAMTDNLLAAIDGMK